MIMRCACLWFKAPPSPLYYWCYATSIPEVLPFLTFLVWCAVVQTQTRHPTVTKNADATGKYCSWTIYLYLLPPYASLWGWNWWETLELNTLQKEKIILPILCNEIFHFVKIKFFPWKIILFICLKAKILQLKRNYVML